MASPHFGSINVLEQLAELVETLEWLLVYGRL